MEIGIWKVTESTPLRYQRGLILKEKLLENWIEQDPSLLSAGLSIVGRQLKIEAGRLDLLGLDPVGNWVIIEIKRGDVRRETITQAIDYAACIKAIESTELQTHVDTYLRTRHSSLTQFLKQRGWDETIFDEHNMIMYVVGTSRDPHLDRMAAFLNMANLAINIVNFDVFENEQGEQIMVRQLTELETGTKARPAAKQIQVISNPQAPVDDTELQRLFEVAEKNGVGREFRFVYEQATKHGLYPRLYKWSIMYTPPTNKTRVLIYVSVKRKYGGYDIWIGAKVFAEFYPVLEKDAVSILGEDRRVSLKLEDLKAVFSNLDKLFVLIDKNKQ
ncbi:MAG: endonuclease NucS domain-containing protein [Chloroflexota bacterium]